MEDSKDDLTPAAWERLNREQGYLMQARVFFKQTGDEDLVQVALAENVKTDDAIDVIRQFTLLVKAGITPPPNILVAVALSFGKYISASGELSLDVAFNLKPKQRVGHPLTHRKEKEERGRICYLMWCLRHSAKLNGETLSIEDAAGKVINQLDQTELSEDVLKKDYIKIRADEIFDGVIKILEEIEAEK